MLIFPIHYELLNNIYDHGLKVHFKKPKGILYLHIINIDFLLDKFDYFLFSSHLYIVCI